MTADFLIHNASEVLTCAGPAPLCGARQANVCRMGGAAVAAHVGRIVYVGPEGSLLREVQLEPNATVIDARGGAIVPGLIDSHTHVIFAGDRRDELRRRLTGESQAHI